MLKTILKNKHLLFLFLGIFIYIAYFTIASFLRYDNFYTGRFDLGNMDQTVWNTIHGRIFQTNTADGMIFSRLGVHADFMLALLSPLYLIWQNPKMLLLVQTIVLSFGALFVYLIANKAIKSKNFALLFGFLYLLNPIVQYPNLYDFHAVTLATTFLLGAFYFLLKRKYLWLILFLVLASITKEEIWLITSIFGIILFLGKNAKTKIYGASIAIFGLFMFIFLIWFAIPNARGGEQHFALSYYSEFGDSPSEIVKNIILSPQKTLSVIFEKDQIDYLRQIFGPLGFISLLSPIVLLIPLSEFLINLLSSNDQLHQIYYQYNSAIIPFVFIAAIFGVKNLKKWFPKIPLKALALYLLICTLYMAYQLGPLPFTKKPNDDMFLKPQKNKEFIESVLKDIPQKYSVSSSNNLGSHLSHREIVTTVPVGTQSADMVLFLVNDFSKNSPDPQIEMIERVRENKEYNEVLTFDGFVVFKRKEILL